VKRTHKDEALSYLTEGCNTFASPQTLHVTVDGVHAAGVENDVFLLWRKLDRGNFAMVAPIQVGWRTGHDSGLIFSAHVTVALGIVSSQASRYRYMCSKFLKQSSFQGVAGFVLWV